MIGPPDPKRFHRFSAKGLRRNIRKKYPRPDEKRIAAITNGALGKYWPVKVTIQHAVYLIVRAHVRHKGTRYDQYLLTHKMSKSEARKIVDEDVNRILERLQDPLMPKLDEKN